MSAWLDNEVHLRSYLWGDLNSDERQRIEERLMTNSATFEELLRVEDELIDSYLEGGLSEPEKEKFENFFLSAPERQQQLAFARALKRYIAEHTLGAPLQSRWKRFWRSALHPQHSLLKWSFVASILLLIAGSLWSAMQISKLRTALEQAGSGDPQNQVMELQNRNSELASALQREQSRVKLLEQSSANLKSNDGRSASSLLEGQLKSTLISVTLAPGLLRDMGGMPKIRVPAGTNLVQFDMKLEPQDYTRYQGTLQRVDGDKLWTQISPGIKAGMEGQFFRLILPAHLFQPGDFIVMLSGIPAAGDPEDVGNYYFRIIP